MSIFILYNTHVAIFFMNAGNYTKWQKFVKNALPRWKKYILSVLLDDSYPVLVVHYENVLNSSIAEVSYTLNLAL